MPSQSPPRRGRRRAFLDDSTIIELFDYDEISDQLNGRETSLEINAADVKRMKPMMAQAGTSEETTLSSQTDDDNMTCAICFEEYVSSGPHRLVSLACGHLFGRNCVEKWLRTEKMAKCPNCKKRAKIKDIRPIYGRIIQMRDTYELEKSKETQRALRAENDSLKLEFAQFKLRTQKEKNELMSKLSSISEVSVRKPPEIVIRVETRCTLSYNGCIDISRDKPMSRAMSLSSDSLSLVATCHCYQTMFHAFAKNTFPIDLSTRRSIGYIPVHEARLRDCRFGLISDNLILSTGEDKSMKITEMRQNKVVQSFELPNNGWNCSWSCKSDQYVYSGLMNGQVLEFDTRNGQLLQDLTAGTLKVPVLAIHVLDGHISGVLVITLKQCVFYNTTDQSNDRIEPYVLVDEEGQISSCSFDRDSNQFCVTFRPGRTYKTVEHKLYQLYTDVSGAIQAEPKASLSTNTTAQTLMTRHDLFPLDGQFCSTLFDETANSVGLYNWTTGRTMGCTGIPSFNADILHILPIFRPSSRQSPSLAILSQSKLHWVDMVSF